MPKLTAERPARSHQSSLFRAIFDAPEITVGLSEFEVHFECLLDRPIIPHSWVLSQGGEQRCGA